MTTTATITPPQAAAARHVLTAPAIAARVAPHIEAGTPDWEAILDEAATMSDGQRLLVHVAHDLAEGTGSVAVRDLPERLGAGSFARVIEALAMCRGEAAWVAPELAPLAAA